MTKLLDTKTFDNERLKRLMDQVVNECKFYKNQIKEYKKVRLFIYFFLIKCSLNILRRKSHW